MSMNIPIKEEAQLYIHYDGFNKRLDEWVPLSCADLESLICIQQFHFIISIIIILILLVVDKSLNVNIL